MINVNSLYPTPNVHSSNVETFSGTFCFHKARKDIEEQYPSDHDSQKSFKNFVSTRRDPNPRNNQRVQSAGHRRFTITKNFLSKGVENTASTLSPNLIY